jgi:pyridoxine kinase
LQSLGYDVWQVNTVQFSNHTGYGKWRGSVFSKEHVRDIIMGIEELGVSNHCSAILSGYMGSAEICEEVYNTVARFKAANTDLIYLCDPVVGGNDSCYVSPDVLAFYKQRLLADIITPNQYEASVLSGINITDTSTLKAAAQHFHLRGIKIVIITGLRLSDSSAAQLVWTSEGDSTYLIETKKLDFSCLINGTGDLFSALYLGSYLRSKNVSLALQHAVYYTEKVLHNTYGHKELQVTSLHYDLTNIQDALPRVTAGKFVNTVKCT